MTTSIIEQDYTEPDRPYSQRELQNNIDNVFRSLRVGKIQAHHKKCDHFYNVKEYGRKEKEINANGSKDIGNCSVCWKFNKTPRHLKVRVRNLINSYCSIFYNPPKYLSYENTEVQITFYKWLYEEFN